MNADVTLDTSEVAALLRAESETVLQLARTGELPGTRIGKSWVFLREDVIAFLKERITKDTMERRHHHASIAPFAIAFPVRKTSRRTVLPPLPDIILPPKKSPKTTS
jgi:excisionase family DNA binding protein